MTEMRATNLAQISGNGDMTRVVLLGVLRNEPMHGYRIKQTLHEWHMDFWADIQGGSIYAGLKRLVSEGLVEKVGSSREGNRPLRTTYRITPSGREELRRILRSFWTPPSRFARPVDIALQFSMELSPDEIEPLLEERLRAIENQSWLFRPEFVPEFDEPRRQARVSDLYDHERRLLAAEREWCEHVLVRLRTGVYHDTAKTPKKKRRTS